ncbi:MAG: RNA chaperone Hfq [Deltaproteobacteria bacterium]|nr:RNA chaperone Hfq [Deltaproteobacteria bacterium]
MAKQIVNVQEQFLNRLRREKVQVVINMVNGSECHGVVSSFDNFCLVLNDGYTSHLLYKHAVARITPQGAGSGALKDFGVENLAGR